MIVGPYDVTPELALMTARMTLDSWRVLALGLRRGPETTPEGLAAGALKRNAGRVLACGEGHFKYMWVADFGKALTGAWDVLGVEYLAAQIEFMTRESGRLGRAASCFRSIRGFDMPWHRGDGLPWLIFSHAELAKRTGRRVQTGILADLLARYEAEWIEDGLVSRRMRGDWVDTIRRPSSTYNNLCVLMMLRRAPELGLSPRTDPDAFAARLLEDRFRGDRFRDYADVEDASVDAVVAALYLRSFGPEVLGPAADRLISLGLDRPWPMRCAEKAYDPASVPWLTRLAPGYHRAHWLHLGMMWLNGLKRLGRDVSAGRAAVEELILRHGCVPEAVEPDGSPYTSPFLSCESGLTMAAGQYLELVGQ